MRLEWVTCQLDLLNGNIPPARARPKRVHVSKSSTHHPGSPTWAGTKVLPLELEFAVIIVVSGNPLTLIDHPPLLAVIKFLMALGTLNESLLCHPLKIIFTSKVFAVPPAQHVHLERDLGMALGTRAMVDTLTAVHISSPYLAGVSGRCGERNHLAIPHRFTPLRSQLDGFSLTLEQLVLVHLIHNHQRNPRLGCQRTRRTSTREPDGFPWKPLDQSGFVISGHLIDNIASAHTISQKRIEAMPNVSSLLSGVDDVDNVAGHTALNTPHNLKESVRARR